VMAVMLTTAVVAFVGISLLHLPLAAAIVLGAIVSPPDAAAATAVLNAVSIPRATETVIRGESLFNDATALLIFSSALTIQSHAHVGPGVLVLIAVAVPGGIVLGILCGLLVLQINSLVVDTLGGNLLQFVISYLVWIGAERLKLSPTLAVVALAMTLASNPKGVLSARMRVHSYAVWSAVVFTLNVFAFLLMGMQARSIVGRLGVAHIQSALFQAAMVVLTIVVSRFLIVIVFNRSVSWLARRQGRPEPASLRQAILVSWCGMRGFVTLATAFALPPDFPARDVVVLAAFAVVIATLIVQGLTLAPVIRLLGLDTGNTNQQELVTARVDMANAALASLQESSGPEAENLRFRYRVHQQASTNAAQCRSLEQHRFLGLSAVHAQREQLERLRSDDRVGIDMYLLLQEELDWNELTLLSERDRRMLES
jgi:monovalent cation/hydrogen antiporter